MKIRHCVCALMVLLFAVWCGAADPGKPAIAEKSAAAERTVADPGKHFFWKVSDSDSHVWILGSIHFGDSSFYPLPKVIEQAFDSSAELAVEIDVSNDSISTEIAKTSAKQGLLPKGKRLPDVIEKNTWKTVDSICAAWNFPSATLLMMRPWMAAMTLSAIAIQRTGIDPSYGIDAVMLDSAAMRGMPIVGLETAEEQISSLSGKSEDDSLGVYYLNTTLREIANLDSMVTQIKRAWKTGNDSLLNTAMNDGETSPDNEKYEAEMEKNVYSNRNQKMAESIGQFLKENRSIFIIIGTAHLVLDEGNVLELLKQKGFKVERF